MALDMNTMSKGEVWINGESIGRYWSQYKASGKCGECSYAGLQTATRCLRNCGQASQRWYYENLLSCTIVCFLVFSCYISCFVRSVHMASIPVLGITCLCYIFVLHLVFHFTGTRNLYLRCHPVHITEKPIF